MSKRILVIEDQERVGSREKSLLCGIPVHKLGIMRPPDYKPRPSVSH
jgi:hypothetical protein